MSKKQNKAINDLAKIISSYPNSYTDKKIRPLPFLGMIIGLAIGLYLDLVFLNYFNNTKLPDSEIAKMLRDDNSLYYPRVGPSWLNILAFPLFGALIGVLLGTYIEKSLNKKSK